MRSTIIRNITIVVVMCLALVAMVVLLDHKIVAKAIAAGLLALVYMAVTETRGFFRHRRELREAIENHRQFMQKRGPDLAGYIKHKSDPNRGAAIYEADLAELRALEQKWDSRGRK